MQKEERRSATILLRIKPSERRKIESRSKRNKVSMAAWVRWLIQEAK